MIEKAMYLPPLICLYEAMKSDSGVLEWFTSIRRKSRWKMRYSFTWDTFI